MKSIRWSNRPEDFTHVNPRNGRSYRVVGQFAQVWMNDQWNPSNVPVTALVAKPSNEVAHSEPEVETNSQTNSEEPSMNVQTLTTKSKEDLAKVLADESIPQEVRDALKEVSEEIDGVLDEECTCLGCQRDALMQEMSDLHDEAEAIKNAVSNGSKDPLTAMQEMVAIAVKVSEVAIKVDAIDKEMESEEEDSSTEYLQGVTKEVIAFLETKGIKPEGDTRKGFVASQAMTIAALDELGYIVKK